MEAVKTYLMTKNGMAFISANRLTDFGSHLRKRGPNSINSNTQKSESNLMEKSKPTSTLDFDSLPNWLKCNEYLQGGYRPPVSSFIACFRSIFSIHNETVNIWSHGLAAWLFLFLLIHNYSISIDDRIWRDKLALTPCIFGFIICFTMSTTFHTVCCHSERVFNRACMCDYIGIVIALLGSLYSAMYYQWYCRWSIGLGYCSFYTGIAPFGFYLFSRSVAAENTNYAKGYRAMVVLVLGISTLSSLFHDIYLIGLEYIAKTYPLFNVSIIFILCLMAAMLYSTRVPERIWPGKFDLWFHSHQIFHVVVVGIALLGYSSLVTFSNTRRNFTNYTNCDYGPFGAVRMILVE